MDASEILGAKGGNENFEGILSAEKMHRHMKHWAPQMKQSLFFLNYVTEIKFFVITKETNCLELERHYRVDIDKSAMARRAELHKKIAQFKDTSGAEPFLQKYQLSLVEVVGSREYKERWLIQQGIGDVENRKQQWQFINQVKPRHGIAAPLNLPKDSDRFRGKVFCFLPLPIDCNLPVHINGHFILHSSRRMLWKTTVRDDVDSKQQWNKILLKAIAASYAHLLMTAKRDYKCESGNISMEDLHRYYKVFPSWTAPPPRTVPSAETNLSQSSATKVPLVHHKHSKSVPQRQTSHQQDHVSAYSAARGYACATSTRSTQGVSSVTHTSQSSDATAALPIAEWLELAKNVFRCLAASNACVLAVVHTTSKKGERKIEWCPLKNKKNPASQVYFVSKDHSTSLKLVLARMGMKLAYTRQWIREHFAHVECYIPTISAGEVYTYYSKFHMNVLIDRSFPCPISDTAFKSVTDFKTFIWFILPAIPTEIPKDGPDIIPASVDHPPDLEDIPATVDHPPDPEDIPASVDHPPDPEDIPASVDHPPDPKDIPASVDHPPLLVTADGLLRLFQKESDSKVIQSNYTFIFPDCLQWFLNPKLIDAESGKPCCPETYLMSLSEEDEENCLEKIERCLASILPANLAKKTCENFVNLQDSLLKNLWRCLSKDELFNHYLGKILEKWALLLSRDNKLYSCCSGDEAILPIIPLIPSSGEVQPQLSDDEEEEISLDTRKKVSIVFEHLNLPFLNTAVVLPEAVGTICPTFCNPKFMLRVLYCFHCKFDISHQITGDMSQILIAYFGYNIHLKKDTQSLEYLKHLPLFVTQSGKFTSLAGYRAYIWPDGMCADGQELWLEGQNVVFLNWSGAWSSLGLATELGVQNIYEVQIYTQFIFDRFRDMDETLRYKHLLYIRDSLLKDAVTQSEIRQSDRRRESLFFVFALRNLKCIGTNSYLRSIMEFYDNKNNIFKTFEKNFLFLPSFFRKGEVVPENPTKQQLYDAQQYSLWMEFFVNLGLHVTITQEEFLQLCHEMANKKHMRNTRKKSFVLFKHLFTEDAQEWLKDYFPSCGNSICIS